MNKIRKIYKIIPFKQSVFKVLRLFFRPDAQNEKFFTFWGDFCFKVGRTKVKARNEGYEIETSIFWRGLTNGWEKETVYVWLALVKNANTILDIGANTGIFSLIAKSTNPRAKVFAFEPMKRVFNILVYNNNINGFDINVKNIALSDHDGEATFYESELDNHYGASLFLSEHRNDNIIETKVEVQTLASFIEQNSIQSIDLIKLDVERHEVEVLKGMQRYLQQFKPAIILEILEDQLGAKIEALITDCGYEYYHLKAENEVTQVNTIAKGSDKNYLLCTTKIKEILLASGLKFN